MPQTNLATDSAAELHDLVGDDATATFENDPKFIDSNPTGNASTDNVTVQSDADDIADADEDGDEEDDDEDEDDDLENDELDDEDDDEVEDEDDEDAADEEDDEEDEETDVDDAAEVAASPTLRADGLLGYEDEADDVHDHRDREQGDAARERAEAKLDKEEDDDAGDVDQGVDEDAADDDLDTDRVVAANVLGLRSSFAHPPVLDRFVSYLPDSRCI